jgi:lysophospholipase L1-like esterase
MIRRILVAVAAACAMASAADDFFLKSGDRVVFYGDSITDQRLYTLIAETYAVTRYPKLDVSFIHSGWGGDRVNGGGGGKIDVRLKRDVLAYRPTVMTIMLGMNDGNYTAESAENDEKFFAGFRGIVNTVRAAAPEVRITAIRPSPYDDVTREPNFPGGYNQVMISYGKWIENFAKEAGLNVADLNTAVVRMLAKADARNHTDAQKIIPDRVHPGFAGHLIMAEELLKLWNARPVVSAVTIDASAARPAVSASDHAQVSGLAAAKGVEWTQLDDALPLPFAEWEKTWDAGPVGLVIASSDVGEALNQQQLRVTGLKNGVYVLKIDGEEAGTFNNERLAEGVNLALLDTPMAKQAKRIYDLTKSHCDLHNQRWRTIQVPLAEDNLPQAGPAMEAIDALEAAVLAERRQAAQPVPHRFSLTPIS